MSGKSVTMKCFSTQEDGNTTIFSVMMVVLVLMITGASVDIMRFEATRTQMQSTLDRAVLAAADLDQKQDPTDVVEDYMAKAGLSEVLSDVVVDNGLNYRTVTATGEVEMDTIFLHMSGFDTLTAPGLSTAEEKISNVEISLVLDVSGSMRDPVTTLTDEELNDDNAEERTKIGDMREAAVKFVDTVVQDPSGTATNEGLTTVSLVPYNATVNLGPTVANYWSLDNTHNYSHCARFTAGEFDTVSIYPSQTLDRLGHFDYYSSDKTSTSINNPWCPSGETSAVVMHSSDKPSLTTHINGLDAGGATAIDVGMKWGVALLDPAAQSAVSSAASDGLVASEASSRPANYTDPEAIKFVVVMTDGENTDQRDLKQSYQGALSLLWVDDRGTASLSDDRYSYKVTDNYGDSNDKYFWVRKENEYYKSNRYYSYPDGGDNARQMTYQDMYARFGMRAAASKFLYTPYYDNYVTANEYNAIRYGYDSIADGDEGDSRLNKICTAAKAKGIVVFAVGFEAPSDGKLALQNCASSPSHYFDVTSENTLTETFHAIARQINSLRLIQ